MKTYIYLYIYIYIAYIIYIVYIIYVILFYIYIYIYIYIWIIPVPFLSEPIQPGGNIVFNVVFRPLQMFSRRSCIGQTIMKIKKSDVDGKSCQNMKLKGGKNINFGPENFALLQCFCHTKDNIQ